MNRHTPTRIAAAALFCAASSAYAQTLLTPAAAAAGNITPGDAPSYPITITKPGLYRLGADLTVPLGTNAIEVTVDNVTIDLNGYSIVSGERTCTQPQTAWTVTCNAFSVPHNYGIRGLSGLVVRNGRVQGFSTGIFFDGGGRMEDLILRYNDYGIWQLPNLTPANSMAGVHVARVLAEFNYSGGMTLWNGYVESSVLKNNNVGLYGSNWVSIASSAAYRNATGLYKTAASGNNVFDNQVDRREVREY